MSISLSIRDVPENLAQLLRERAKRNHRSLQGELLSILEDTLLPGTLTIEDALGKIRSLDFYTPNEATQMIREDRDGGYRS